MSQMFVKIKAFKIIIKVIIIIYLLILLNIFVSLIINLEINKKIKVALCAMGRNEILYINEFINFYLSLGVDTLFLYDDNVEEKEKFINVVTPKDSVVIEYCQNYNIQIKVKHLLIVIQSIKMNIIG